MLDKTEDQQKRLGDARADLAAAEASMVALASAEAAESKSPEGYKKWKADFENLKLERERLTILIGTLERDMAQNAAADAEAAIRKRHAEKLKSNAALAKQIRQDVERINETALKLLRAVATSAQEDVLLNLQLPDDLEPLVGADQLARGRAALQREEISRENVWLWTRTDGGSLIGDQNGVEDRGGGEGSLVSGMSRFACKKVLFTQVTYHPAEAIERVQPLYLMKLMHADRPGFLFDGSRFSSPRAILAALDQIANLKAPPERPVEIELLPTSIEAVAED
jgi:hypothetical protein